MKPAEIFENPVTVKPWHDERSSQLGHANAKMPFTVYAKWIDSADRGREKAKMEAVLRFHSTEIHIRTNSNLS